MRRFTLLLAACGVFVGSAVSSRAACQNERWRIDPYTRNDADLMKRAGYVSYGPFEFGEQAGQPVTTAQIEEMLGDVKILWVETAHFKIGSALPAWPVPMDRATRKMLEGELETLAKKLPRIKTKPRVLDRWLRLHMFAQRCEETYDDFMERLDITEDAFPQEPNALLRNGKYWGEGPYLGQQAKYTVLLLEKATDLTRYKSTYIGMNDSFAQRWNFKTVGSQLLATAEEADEGRLKHDTAMHCHVVWNVIHNLINGYRFYSYDLPVWFTEGCAHWFARQISPDWNNFDQNESARANLINFSDWDVKTRQWLLADKFRSVSEILQLRDFGALTKEDHLQCWSLVDYLMQTGGDEKWAAYMNEVKGFIDRKTGLAVGSQLLDLQRDALRKVYNLNPLTFEQKWKEWVMETYPGR